MVLSVDDWRNDRAKVYVDGGVGVAPLEALTSFDDPLPGLLAYAVLVEGEVSSYAALIRNDVALGAAFPLFERQGAELRVCLRYAL